MEGSYRRANILFLKGVYLDNLKNADDIFDRKFTGQEAAPASRIIYQSLPEQFTTLEAWPKSTNLKCWECDCTFSTVPVPCAVDMYHNKNGQTVYDVYGNFCTFNCAQKHINEKFKGDATKYDKDRFLRALYKIFTGKKIDHIVSSPDKTRMQQYCGERGWTYREFRDKIYEITSDYELTMYRFDQFTTTL